MFTRFATVNQASSVSVLDWLSVRYLLRSLTDNVIETCYEQILDSFNGKKNIIQTLVKASTSEQLQNIVEILKAAQSEEIEKNNNKIMMTNNEYHSSYFDLLSESSIFNICEFLSAYDIAHFKCTCTFISLIALQLMNGYKIGVLNMNELIECEDYRFSTQFTINDKITINRIKQFSKKKSLMDVYRRRYNISHHNSLILSSSTLGNNYNAALMNCYNKNEQTFDKSKVHRQGVFFVFDKTKVLTLNNTSKLKMMSQIHQPEQMKDYKLILLQYYDAHEQHIQNIQFLWYDTNTTLSRLQKYILNDLYSIYQNLYKQSSEWCNKLLYTMNKMKQFGNTLSLISIYTNAGFEQYLWKYQKQRFEIFQTITFQINYFHPYWQIKQNLGASTQLNRFYPFCKQLNHFIEKQKASYSVECETVSNIEILQTQLNYFQNNEKCKTSIINVPQNLRLHVTPNTTFQLIKNQISSKLNKIAPPKHIQVYEGQEFWSSGKIKAAKGKCGLKMWSTCWKWEIVTYNTLLDRKRNIHQISIYDHEEDGESIFKLPQNGVAALNMDCSEFYGNNQNDFNDDSKTNTNKIAPLKLKVNLFIKRVMDTLSHPMHGNHYKSLIDKYNSEYSFVIMNEHDKNNKQFVCYDDNDEYNQYIQSVRKKKISKNNGGFFSDLSDSILSVDHNINIYVVKHINYTKNDSYIPIIVRFCRYSGFINLELSFSSFNEIGVPVKIWISKQSTMSDILKQYFGEEYKNKFEYKTSYSTVGELSVDDVIYQKISKSSMDNELSENKMKWNQILIGMESMTNKTCFSFACKQP